MPLRNLTIAAVIAELILFVILAVALQSETASRLPTAASGTAGPPTFQGNISQFTAMNPRLPAPDIEFRDGRGHKMSFADFRGKVVLLNLWATWCDPCKREMPSLDRLQAAMGGPDFDVVALSVDRKGAKLVLPWLRRNGIDRLGIYLDPDNGIVNALDIRGLPTTFVIDRTGHLAGKMEGPADWDSRAAKALVRYYLGESR